MTKFVFEFFDFDVSKKRKCFVFLEHDAAAARALMMKIFIHHSPLILYTAGDDYYTHAVNALAKGRYRKDPHNAEQ